MVGEILFCRRNEKRKNEGFLFFHFFHGGNDEKGMNFVFFWQFGFVKNCQNGLWQIGQSTTHDIFVEKKFLSFFLWLSDIGKKVIFEKVKKNMMKCEEWSEITLF